MNFAVPVWLLLVLLVLVVLTTWSLLGLRAMEFYVFRVNGKLRPLWEAVFTLLCGPVVWLRILRLRRSPNILPPDTTPIYDDDEGVLPDYLRRRADYTEE